MNHPRMAPIAEVVTENATISNADIAISVIQGGLARIKTNIFTQNYMDVSLWTATEPNFSTIETSWFSNQLLSAGCTHPHMANLNNETQPHVFIESVKSVDINGNNFAGYNANSATNTSDVELLDADKITLASNVFNEVGEFGLLAVDCEVVVALSNTFNNESKLLVGSGRIAEPVIFRDVLATFFTDNNVSSATYGLQGYASDNTYKFTIEKNIFNLNETGLLFGQEVNPLENNGASYDPTKNTDFSYEIDAEVSCNQFLLNNIAWAGSGDFKDQGATSYYEKNQFVDNVNWDVIYDINTAKWEYFHEDVAPTNEILNSASGLNKTSVDFNNSSVTNLNYGVAEQGADPLVFGSDCNPLFMKRSLDVAEVDSEIIIIYPNPFYNEITVESSSVVNGTILVQDIVGKLVATVPIAGNTTTVQLNGLTNGLYIVEVRDSKSNRVLTTKILKQ